MFEQTIRGATQVQIERVRQVVDGRDDAWAIPRVSAEFLHALALAGGYRRGLELGTSYGYSGLWLGAAFQHNGGQLTTIDQDPAKTAFAREAFAQAGLDDTIRVLHGQIEDVLPTLAGPFDFVFIDADKETVLRYLELLWPLLAQRATLVTDNITSHAEQMTGFVQHLRRHPRLCSVLVPIGSGLELTVKLDPFTATASIDGADWVI